MPPFFFLLTKHIARDRFGVEQSSAEPLIINHHSDRALGAELLSDYSEIMPNGERRITLSPDEIAEYVDQIIETNQSHMIDREGK